ncbi:hypothetical protein SAMN00808754_1586 [Thermanaeromonas toyohensis ToBE]|uniref:Uncharacterized protein n=1 Tax=Thermanaeromonas toyohensis ToBE TaxID=698762 RepID=A0A1W1VUX8_9FIRM|nr:hypothetical protein SAMN00808754_1586 [Thermanaeromonas toyohensis ToBE]
MVRVCSPEMPLKIKGKREFANAGEHSRSLRLEAVFTWAVKQIGKLCGRRREG